MSPEKTETLCTKFPLVFSYSGDKTDSTFFHFECGDGWYQVIYDLADKLETRINEIILQSNESLTASDHSLPHAVQVKEKFGSLRFLTYGANDDMRDLIDIAETASSLICEECGDAGVLRSGGWLQTLCDGHANGRGTAKKLA